MSVSSQLAVGRDDLERFWSKVEVGAWNACWPWSASCHPDGYGQFVFAGRPIGAHRLAHAIAHDRWPSGLRIAHRCDDPSCVNPSHLVVARGTVRHERMARTSRPLLLSDADAERFWSKVAIGTWDACWLWTASLRTGGYGSFWLSGSSVGAHRVAYSLVRGPVPEMLCVCHQCDNPACVNPGHLFLGTQQENQADKVQKQRHARFEAHGAARLTRDVADQIREMAADGVSKTALASRFGVSRAVVHSILSQQIWRPR